MIKISNLKLPLTYDYKTLEDIVIQMLCINQNRIESINIDKRTVNNQDKQNVHFDMTLLVSISGDENEVIYSNKGKGISKEIVLHYSIPEKKLKNRPVVVGFGPAGMFAALILAQSGARPILLERGKDVDSRKLDVLKFWQTGILDTQSNVQFGEGGAGTFSDGKLKIGRKDPRKIKILRELIDAGAPPEIMYLSKPHIGTDRLHEVVKIIRKKIISLGGEIHFNAAVTKILQKNGHITGITYEENGNSTEIPTDNVVLAIGHSARDTFQHLITCGVHVEQKPFALGVRIEHPQDIIDKLQYAGFAGHPALGAADYKMVVHLQNGTAVYTFCMCPGGSVVAATSETNALVTNGMSEFARDGRNSNSALLVTIDPKHYGNDSPLAGINFQRKIESAAFAAGGGGYKAPVQRLEDFFKKRKTVAFGNVHPTYLPGTTFSEVDSYLPDFITNSLRQGILEMDAWMPGFSYPDALLTGAETRSSSPLRITRSDSLEAIGIKGLYPCGEGAGYSGGIISAAVDGILCAERILGV